MQQTALKYFYIVRFAFSLLFLLVASHGKPLWNRVLVFGPLNPKSGIPTLSSGPLPKCVPMPWDELDPCHRHVCAKGFQFVTSVCSTFGTSCGKGEYLKIRPTATTKEACCFCSKFDK